MKPVIFRQEGTSCAVYSIGEHYVPCVIQPQASNRGDVLMIVDSTPIFDTLGEAWAFHLKTLEDTIAQQHANVDSSFSIPLQVLKKHARVPLKLVVAEDE